MASRGSATSMSLRRWVTVGQRLARDGQPSGLFLLWLIFLSKNMAAYKNIFPPQQVGPGDLPDLSPLSIEWLAGAIRIKTRQPDGRLRVHLPRYGQSHTFVFEFKKDWTARPFSEAIKQARAYAADSGDLPLVILPYMSDEHLDTLYEADISGMDLCGNALLNVQPDWFVRFTGRPNRFRSTQPLKSPYQGKSALVARALLACPVLPNAEALRAEVEQRGGKVSQPVISRALKAFRDDLIVGSQGEYSVVLLQPEKLLDRLLTQWRMTVEDWQKSGSTVLWRGRTDEKPETILAHLFKRSHQSGSSAVLTGLTSSVQRTNLTIEDTNYLYVPQVGDLLDNLKVTETRRFPNLELWSPPDEAVFFDAMTDERGWKWASPLQTYLELETGDARLQGTAGEFRAALLNDMKEKKSALLQGKVFR